MKQKSFQVISETPTVTVRKDMLHEQTATPPLWSGIDQKLTMAIYSGSHCFKKVSQKKKEKDAWDRDHNNGHETFLWLTVACTNQFAVAKLRVSSTPKHTVIHPRNLLSRLLNKMHSQFSYRPFGKRLLSSNVFDGLNFLL